MKKMTQIVLPLLLSTLIFGCSSAKKNADGSDAVVTSETTGSGSTEKVDSSAMNFHQLIPGGFIRPSSR